MRMPVRYVILAFFSALTLVLVLQNLTDSDHAEGFPSSPLYEDLKLIRKALFMYERGEGHFPYSERGPSYAFYKLRPCFSNLPGILAEDAWDEQNQRLTVDHLYYANEVPVTNAIPVDSTGEHVLVSIPVENGGRLCLSQRGLIFYKE